MSITLNGDAHPLDNIKTVADLLASLGYENQRLAVELNGQIVPKSEHATTSLKQNDAVEIVVAVGGG